MNKNNVNGRVYKFPIPKVNAIIKISAYHSEISHNTAVATCMLCLNHIQFHPLVSKWWFTVIVWVKIKYITVYEDIWKAYPKFTCKIKRTSNILLLYLCDETQQKNWRSFWSPLQPDAPAARLSHSPCSSLANSSINSRCLPVRFLYINRVNLLSTVNMAPGNMDLDGRWNNFRNIWHIKLTLGC